MSEIIFGYFDSKDLNDKYIFAFFFEAFKGLEVFTDAISDTAISQGAMILRQAIEEVSLVSVLLKYKSQVLGSFAEHLKFANSLDGYDEKNRVLAAREFLKRKGRVFDERLKSLSKSDIHYIRYGWMESVCKDGYGIEKLIELGGFKDLSAWRKLLNRFTHMRLSALNFTKDEKSLFLVESDFVYIASSLLDKLCCDFHNFTNFGFVFGQRRLFDEFRRVYEGWTAEKKANQN